MHTLARAARKCAHFRLMMCYRFQRFKFKYNLYKLREERTIKPSTFGRLVSATLYEKRCGSRFGSRIRLWSAPAAAGPESVLEPQRQAEGPGRLGSAAASDNVQLHRCHAAS